MLDDLFHLFHVLIGDPFTPPIAPVQAVEDVLPDDERGFKPARPFAAALEFPFEAPLAGEFVGAEEAALASVGVGIGPLDFDRHGSGFRAAAFEVFDLLAQAVDFPLCLAPPIRFLAQFFFSIHFHFFGFCQQQLTGHDVTQL